MKSISTMLFFCFWRGEKREKEQGRGEREGFWLRFSFSFSLLVDALIPNSPNSAKRLFENDRPTTEGPHSYASPVGKRQARAVLVERDTDHELF